MRRFILSILLLVPCSAFAWGNTGHRVVAMIAERQLSPAARSELKKLLGNQPLASIATTADALRTTTRPETEPWHFTDIPREEATYLASRDCTNGDCVVDRLEHFIAVLSDHNASIADRKEALMFVTHFAGDIAQPLHCAEGKLPNGDNDRGATRVMVRMPGTTKNQKLHGVWDSSLIVTEELSERDLVDHLIDDVLGDRDPATLNGGTVEEWANASHKLAVEHAYVFPANHRLNAAYVTDGVAVVDEQLLVAGLRLAKILERALA